MLGLPSFFPFTLLLASLGTAAVVFDVPRSLRQTTRREVVQRMSLHPDGTWTAKRQTVSPVPTCGTQAGGGTHQCTYDDYCQNEIYEGTQIAPTFTAASFDACVASCDSTVGCASATYISNTRACLEYSDSSPTLHGGRPEAESIIFDPNVHGSHPGLGTCGCNFYFYCRMQAISNAVEAQVTQASFTDCVALCDTTTDCNSATYQFSTGACTLITEETPTLVANTDYESILCDSSVFCPGPCFPPP